MRDKHLGAPSLVRSPHPNSNSHSNPNPNSAHNTPQREEETAHRAHLHQHNLFHNKRQTATAVDVQSVITEVVQTVSYLQQIDVDPNGSTFSIQTILADSTAGEYVPPTTDASAATTTEPASPGTWNTASSASSTGVALSLPESSSLSSSSSSTTQSLLSNQSTTSTSSSVSSIPTTSSFASFIITSNTTTLISSSSAFTPSFSNSTITSSLLSSSSFTYLSSTSSSSSSGFSSSTASFYSPSYSSSSPSATSIGGGGIIVGGGGTGVATGSTSTSTAAAGNGTTSGSSSAPSTSTVVGSVVGSVAGAAILIVVLMMFLRWKKRHQNMLSLGSGDPGPAPSQPTGGMSGPRSSLFAIPGALASLSGFKSSSRPADQTTPTEAGGERGFYRVSGRKLASVLQTGGDGYGDDVVDNTLSGSSFYRDSEGFYGGPGSPTFTAPIRPESGIPVMRPSPARTPVTEPGPFAFPNPPAPLTPPLRPDVLGRSHPSQDGSHASRFTEEV